MCEKNSKLMRTDQGGARWEILTIDHDNVSLLDATLPQSPCQRLDLIQQLGICVLFLGIRHGTVPVNSNLVPISGLYVAIHAVVTR